uniref:LD13080p n=1 Tax=Drosophila melanogaster TaxID=7227 RepID=Q8SX85_DROME|nr:LD13080p [Drosophila melanogaster]ADM07119.1 RE66492p [Drosophila melanogaster]
MEEKRGELNKTDQATIVPQKKCE